MDPVGLGLIIVGAAIAAFGWWRYRRALGIHERAAGTWRKVDGTLHEASLREEVTWDSQNDQITEYHPVVRYSYRADGRDHEGTRAFLSRTKFADEREGKTWLDQRKPGGATAVWHDPADPAQSVLEIDRPAKAVLFVAGVFALIAIGVGTSLL